MVTLIKSDGSVVESYAASSLSEELGGEVEIIPIDGDKYIAFNPDANKWGKGTNGIASAIAGRQVFGDAFIIKSINYGN